MAGLTDCCSPCPSVQTVNIPGTPGAQGDAGADGTDGVNAFTLTTADFVVPSIGNTVTVLVADSTWATVGQNVFVQGAGYFSVSSKPGSGSMVLEYLDYNGNTHTGDTISTGAQISPGGTQPVSATPITSYALAGAQVLTATPAQALSISVTLPTSGTYILLAHIRVDFSNATTLSSQTVTAKLRRTNGTPGDLSDAIVNMATGVVTTATATMEVAPLPAIAYTATAGDIVQLYASIDAVPYVGDVIAVEASILAFRQS